jgi:hypothetical protein
LHWVKLNLRPECQLFKGLSPPKRVQQGYDLDSISNLAFLPCWLRFDQKGKILLHDEQELEFNLMCLIRSLVSLGQGGSHGVRQGRSSGWARHGMVSSSVVAR